MYGSGLTRYHTPVVSQKGQGLSRFLDDLSSDLFEGALSGAKQGALKGFKSRGRWGLPSIRRTVQGAKTGATSGAKRVLKRKASSLLDSAHASAKRKVNDIFS